MDLLTSSQRMADVQAPIIPVIGDLIRANPGTISLAQGVVSYPPPAAALESLSTFASDVSNHLYGSSIGQADLLSLIKEKLELENHIKSDLTDRVIVTAGANMAFLTALFAIIDSDDEVILPTPYYFNHEMAIKMLDASPVLVPTDAHFQLDIDQIKAAITDRTRAIVTISPNNPSGVMYPREVLGQINRLCRDRGLYHICDEAYEYFTYGENTHFSPLSSPDSVDHTIGIYSLSKAYGFASWRVGYMVIPPQLLLPIMKVQDTNLICNSLIAQHAAQAALTTGRTYCDAQVKQLDHTRELILTTLEPYREQVSFPDPQGAFYLMMKVQTDLPDMLIVERLIKEHRVGVLPGSAFGLENGCYLRVSFGALQVDTALSGIQRLMNGLQAICYN